jgi:membrane-bound inhibitor of C-type lysozyme
MTTVADDHKYAVTATSTLSLTHVVSQRSFSESASSTFTIGQSAVAGGAIRKDAESILQTESVEYDIDTDTLTTIYVGLDDAASVTVRHATHTASNIISFAQPAAGYKVLAGAIAKYSN